LAGSYKGKYSKKTGRRPECFADPEEYDLGAVCRGCDWRRPCRGLVLQKRAREEEEEESRREDRKTKNPEDFEERESADGVGFCGALVINGSLCAMGAALGEAQYAVDQIRRIPYGDPIKAAIDRGRAKAKKDKE